MRSMRQRCTATVIVGLFFAATAAIAPAESPQGMKLYVFSSGALTIGKNILQNLGPTDTIQVPVGFFVVMHPMCYVLFDTGNNDKIITDPSYWGAFFKAVNPVVTPDVAIDAQLGKIGLKPDDIKYVVVGHLHLDHGGNVGKFPNSIVVVQKDEIRRFACRQRRQCRAPCRFVYQFVGGDEPFKRRRCRRGHGEILARGRDAVESPSRSEPPPWRPVPGGGTAAVRPR